MSFLKIPFSLQAALIVLALAALANPLPAQAPPATFTRTISTTTESVTVHFTLHSIRNADFEVFVQQADGSYLTPVADVSRTYLGTVDERPGAIACGLLLADGTLWARISMEDGKTWTLHGGTATQDGPDVIPEWPTTVIGSGGAGSSVYAAEFGIDSTNNHYIACGGTTDAVVRKCEFSVLCTDMIYLRDAAIVHRIGKIVIRADLANDPYVSAGGDGHKLLPLIDTIWEAGVPMGFTRDLAGVMHSAADGGLAWVGAVGSNDPYSANDTASDGDFWTVWRHEVGHNWSANHYEGGGHPEGPTIMSDNALSRFSSSELKRIVAHRYAKAALLDNLGNYPFPIPPRANQDAVTFQRQNPVTIDALDNDSDSNGESISLLSFDSASAFGGIVTRSAGTGPGGRDQMIYTPPSPHIEGTDWFKYRIQDSSGMQSVGYVVVRPGTELVIPADHWTLDDSSGTVAVNRMHGYGNGTHKSGVLVNQPGANSVTRKGAYYDGVNDYTVSQNMNYNTNTVTFTTWVKRDGSQNAYASLISMTGYNTETCFSFGTANELRYTWHGGQTTWNSGITVPDNQWCLAAMCASPAGTTLYLRTAAGLQSATNAVPNPIEELNAVINFGWDSRNGTRHFKGWLDDVRIFTKTLNADNIESLYQQAVDPPAIALTAPAAGSAISPLDVDFDASVTTHSDLVDSVDFVENGATFATATSPLYRATLAGIAPGPHTVSVHAGFGDWNYETESAPVTFTALPPPPPVVTVLASSSASKLGPVPGSFTFTRGHPLGKTTVPFTLSGTAVAGTDYDAIPTSVTFPDGSLTQTFMVNPIAAAPDEISETLVLTLGAGAGHTLGTPSSATLVIDDHITSIASGSWNAGATWNNGAPAPTTGTQNSGASYAIAHTVTSNDPRSGSQALVAGGLRVLAGGILDLARLHAYTNQNVTYNIPPTTVEDGGSIQFRCSAGSSTHTLPAALAFSGSTALSLTGGSYENNATLSGRISGSGTITILADSPGGLVPRKISVNSANNPFAGNWKIDCTGNGRTGLRSAAAKALGKGFVTVGTRSQLINDSAAGLDSLSGVILTGVESSLILNQPWNAPAASLDLAAGSPLIQLGNASSSIGNLTAGSGATGIVQGSGPASLLTVNQTSDGIYQATLGTQLAFVKSGPAKLALTGPLDPGLRLSMAQGNLAFGSLPVTITSLNQTGGTLELNLPAEGNPALILTGNLIHASGSILLHLPAAPLSYLTPYKIITYQGALTGAPAIVFSKPVHATIDYGTGNDSFISVVFHDLVELTISNSPADGGTGLGAGSYDRGAPAAISATPSANWQFDSWTGSGIDSPANASTSVAMDSAKSIVANFTRIQRLLTVTATEGGTATGGGTYDQDSTQTINAVPDAGYNFVNWTGATVADPNSASTTVQIDAPLTVTAHFISDYDLWAQSRGLTGPAAERNADPDDDGMTNLMEMAFDFLPTDPNSRLKMKISATPAGEISLVVNKMVPACHYVLERTTNLTASWERSGEIPVTEAVTNFTITPPLQPGRCFYRLRCTLIEP